MYMKQAVRVALVVVMVAGIVFSAVGCKPKNPEDAISMAVAAKFVTAVWVNGSSCRSHGGGGAF